MKQKCAVTIAAATLPLFCSGCMREPEQGVQTDRQTASATITTETAAGTATTATTETAASTTATTTTTASTTAPAETAAPGLQLTVLLDATNTSGPVQKPSFHADEFASLRENLVSQSIEQEGVKDPQTLAAMRRVPRHKFVEIGDARFAYLDRPLPIGHGQTISQPYIVGYMTELLQLKPEHRVLEIGTGSAYQAAILAEIAQKVNSIEIVEPLARAAADRLKRLGYSNITVVHGDGYHGWQKQAPYDAIMVTAAAEHIPPPLIAQLKPGGRMVIPVGQVGWTQNLLLVEKRTDGSVQTQNLLPVTFVPLTRSD